MTLYSIISMIAFILCWPTVVTAQLVSTGKYLYTQPDPSAAGGIKGEIVSSQKPLVAVFALPPDEPKFVYKGTVTGSNNLEFVFNGLPAAKYDLVLVFNDVFYEGLTLNRSENTLTSMDHELIEKIIMKSEPFYNKKVINRLEGKTGKMEGNARCICSFLRTQESVDYDAITHPEHRRSLKLVLLEDVGPGWQVSRTREIFVTFVKPGNTAINHVYRKNLGCIRVTDSIKDLGKINLK